MPRFRLPTRDTSHSSPVSVSYGRVLCVHRRCAVTVALRLQVHRPARSRRLFAQATLQTFRAQLPRVPRGVWQRHCYARSKPPLPQHVSLCVPIGGHAADHGRVRTQHLARPTRSQSRPAHHHRTGGVRDTHQYRLLCGGWYFDSGRAAVWHGSYGWFVRPHEARPGSHPPGSTPTPPLNWNKRGTDLIGGRFYGIWRANLEKGGWSVMRSFNCPF